MTEWKIFKIVGIQDGMSSTGSSWKNLILDDYVEFTGGYEKSINVYSSNSVVPFFSPCGVTKTYIEIDMDKTKYKDEWYVFRDSDYALRNIPQELAIRRNMTIASSVDQTALTITREGIERVNRGEIGEFEYKMVDNSGNKHQWIYRK